MLWTHQKTAKKRPGFKSRRSPTVSGSAGSKSLNAVSISSPDGLVPSCLYEEPEPHIGQSYAMDYPALFAASLADYVDDTGD